MINYYVFFYLLKNAGDEIAWRTLQFIR